MFCFKCGASMPDESKVCPQCAAPVQEATPPSQVPQPTIPTPASTSAWLNVPAAPVQNTPQPQYQPQYQPYRGQYPQQTDGGAIASLVLGIASFVLCLNIFTGIPAIIVGHISRSKISRSGGRLKGDGIALAGLILGYCSLPVILFFAAILVPNLQRTRITFNEARAIGTMNGINIAQASYQRAYPARGYAPDLATLGHADASCSAGGNADHACLLHGTIADSNCTSGVWCKQENYRFTIVSNCHPSSSTADEGQSGGDAPCVEYVAVATPINPNTGLHNFCVVSGGIVRSVKDTPLENPPTAEECSEWSPVGNTRR
jgi:hypothetical protein